MKRWNRRLDCKSRTCESSSSGGRRSPKLIDHDSDHLLLSCVIRNPSVKVRKAFATKANHAQIGKRGKSENGASTLTLAVLCDGSIACADRRRESAENAALALEFLNARDLKLRADPEYD